MAKHKLVLDDVFEDLNYSLIAIHCSLEDYRLAYLLNKELSLNLARNEEDLDFENMSTSYSIYEWEDMGHQAVWNLVSNVYRKETDTANFSDSLFGDNEKTVQTHNLISEHKNVDYFLRISSETTFSNDKTIVNRIQEIPQIITAYAVDVTKLKSRNNLIFN